MLIHSSGLSLLGWVCWHGRPVSKQLACLLFATLDGLKYISSSVWWHGTPLLDLPFGRGLIPWLALINLCFFSSVVISPPGWMRLHCDLNLTAMMKTHFLFWATCIFNASNLFGLVTHTVSLSLSLVLLQKRSPSCMWLTASATFSRG